MKSTAEQLKQTARSSGFPASNDKRDKGAKPMKSKGKKHVSLLKLEGGRYIITSPRGRNRDYKWRSLVVLDIKYGKPVTVQSMYERTGYSNPTVYRQSVIRRLVDERLAIYDASTDAMVITLLGTQRVKEWEFRLNG